MELDDKSLLNELEKRFLNQIETLKELNNLNEQLKSVNHKLEKSESLKGHFISNIANELVNPFSAIIGLSKNVILSDEEDWDRVMKMVELIHTEAFNLDFQLRNIFMAAKIEAGEITPEFINTDVIQILNSLVQEFYFEAQKKGISFDYSNDGIRFFVTDPEKLRVIVANLMSNAVKFSHINDKIELRSTIDNDNLIIVVKDYGTGISEENQKIIFDRFQRIDAGINTENRGHGLGLSINRALIDTLEGDIHIKTKEKEGSEITVTIPKQDIECRDIALDSNEFLFDQDAELF